MVSRRRKAKGGGRHTSSPIALYCILHNCARKLFRLNDDKEQGRRGEGEKGRKRFLFSPALLPPCPPTLLFLCLLLCGYGCGDGLISPEKDIPYSLNRDSGFTAIDFPSKDGMVWVYTSIPSSPQEKVHTYSVSIDGTRNVIGYTHRRAKYTEGEGSKAGIPTQSFDFFSSLLFPIPLTSTFFLKDTDSYVENAFEIFLDTRGDVVAQPDIPPRVLWVFPMKLGKEWIVSKTKSNPERTVIRKVVADGILVKVPKGNFPNSYLIEERFFIGDQPPEQPTSRYWISPNAGVVRYEYRDIFSRSPDAKRTYELKELRIP